MYFKKYHFSFKFGLTEHKQIYNLIFNLFDRFWTISRVIMPSLFCVKCVTVLNDVEPLIDQVRINDGEFEI